MSVRMCRLRPWIFFAASKPLNPLLVRAVDRLAVDDGRAGRGFPPGPLSVGHQKGMVNRCPNTLDLPAAQIVVDRLPGREIVRQQPPGRAGAELIEDGLNDPALVRFPRPPTGLGFGDQRLKNSPLVVR